MFGLLLPLISSVGSVVAVTAVLPPSKVQPAPTPMTLPEMETAVAEGVRQRLAAGWLLVDAHDDADDFVFTLRKADVLESHIAHVEGPDSAQNTYRVVPAPTLPRYPRAPDGFMLVALTGGGGVELESSCGGIDARPYVLDARATGPAAGRLVARTLRSSDDLEHARLDGGRAVFSLEIGGHAVDLIAVVDDHDVVTTAEVRHYRWGSDTTTYRRQRALKRAVAGGSVTSIIDDGDGPVLFVGAKRFEIDHEQFVSNHPDEDGACGC